MKQHYLFIFIILFLLTNSMKAQFMPRGVCGVHSHDMELMELLYPNDEKGWSPSDRNATIHIPIQFHLVATSTGTGRVTPNIVLKQLCKLNEDFSNTNIRFYLYDLFRNIDNTGIYTSPATNANAIQQRKVTKALNVFITDKADPEGALGTVLGYYNSQGDYIVLTKAEAIKQSNTLSHEIGHFLSLRHTFHGWERDPWNKAKHNDTIQVRYTLDGAEIEFMNKTNCAIASDQLCDTPPDYNFGFTSSGCNYAYEVWDYNYEKVTPQKENQMSYFSNCSDFVFTPNQVTRMTQNYNSSARNYLKNNTLPSLDTVTGPVTLIHPVQGQQLTVFDGVLLDWEDVPNATHYILEIRNLFSNEYLIVNVSEYYATNLKKSQQYTYEVVPFSFGHFCIGGTSATFKTGSQSITSVADLASNLKLAVYPNPTANGTPVVAQFELPERREMEFQLWDVNGKQITTEKKSFDAGKQYHVLYPDARLQGVYLLKIISGLEFATVRILLHP